MKKLRQFIVAGVFMIAVAPLSYGLAQTTKPLSDQAVPGAAYDKKGRLKKMREADTGRTLCFDYDDAGRQILVRSIDGNCNRPPRSVAEGILRASVGVTVIVRPLDNDTDDENNELFIDKIEAPKELKVKFNSKTKELSITPKQYGEFTIYYHVTDLKGGYAPAALEVNVTS